jgi:hypothetical protein
MRKTRKQYGRGSVFSVSNSKHVEPRLTRYESESLEKGKTIVNEWIKSGDVNVPLRFYKLVILPKFPDNVRVIDILLCKDLKQIPKFPETVREIRIAYCNLKELSNLPNSLEKLHCGNNNLTTLPFLPHGLTDLDCNSNKLKSLPALPDNLKKLICSNNQLREVPSLPNGLTHLDCASNKLKSLPRLPNSLIELLCYGNSLVSLPILPDGLEKLICFDNRLVSLPILPDRLTALRIDGNNLPELFDYGDENNAHEVDIEHPNLYYINRIRKLQKSKKNITNSIISHATTKKRNVFANTTYNNMPRNVVKQIANYMDEEDLENININSLKPRNVKRGETRKLKKV